jgi:CTP synthase (UTP-ammonia lyase)
VGQRHAVRIRPDTRAAALYRTASADEEFYCNYGVNPEWVRRLEAGGLRVSAVGDAGEPRIVELPGHPFYVATLFLPPARSSAAEPHPLLVGFADAVRASARAEARPG